MSTKSSESGPYFTAKRRDELQERLYTLTMKLIDSRDVELAIKGATLLEKMYQSDQKPTPAAKGKPEATGPLSADARKAAIQARLNAVSQPSAN